MGPNVGKEQKKAINIGKEKNLSVEKTKEKKETAGKRKEKRIEFTVSKSMERSITDAISVKNNQDLTIQISVSDLLSPTIIQFEQQHVAPFSSCKLYTNPPTLRDIGINFRHGKIIDVSTKEYFEQQARQQDIAEVQYQKLKKYVDCAFQYADIMQCATIQLEEIATTLQNWIGIIDMRKYAQQAVQNCLRKKTTKITAATALKSSFIVPCRWMGSLDNLRCGGTVVSFSPFSVRVGSLQIFGEGKFLGLAGTFRVSSAFSLDQTFAQVVRNAKNKNEAYSLAKYIENLESQGKFRKAAIIKKKVVEQAKTGHISLSLSSPF